MNEESKRKYKDLLFPILEKIIELTSNLSRLVSAGTLFTISIENFKKVGLSEEESQEFDKLYNYMIEKLKECKLERAENIIKNYK